MSTPAQPQTTIPGYNTEQIQRNRMVVVQHVYFQAAGASPVKLVEARYNRWLQSQDDPFTKHYTIQPLQTQLMNYGWLETQGLLIVSNMEGTQPRSIQPSQEELDKEASKVLLVGVHGSSSWWKVLPKETHQLTPPSKSQLVLYNPGEHQVKCMVTLLPE